MPSRRWRGLLHPESRGARSRAPARRVARPARLFRDADEHADDDRVGHRVREAGLRPGGPRLMAGLRGKALAAYLVVCVVWGSTSLAIRVGVGVLPPFLFAGLRFLVAGALSAPPPPPPRGGGPRRPPHPGAPAGCGRRVVAGGGPRAPVERGR